MKTKTYYSTVDRSEWPRGPWDDEPEDKVQWQDAATDLPCLARRVYHGAWCGYVGVPATHPLYEAEEDSVDVDVHGGLSFSGPCDGEAPEASGICHVPDEGEPDDVWWFGFDCAHAGDWSATREIGGALRALERRPPDAKYRTLAYVKRQCAKLAEQLRRMDTMRQSA